MSPDDPEINREGVSGSRIPNVSILKADNSVWLYHTTNLNSTHRVGVDRSTRPVAPHTTQSNSEDGRGLDDGPWLGIFKPVPASLSALEVAFRHFFELVLKCLNSESIEGILASGVGQPSKP